MRNTQPPQRERLAVRRIKAGIAYGLALAVLGLCVTISNCASGQIAVPDTVPEHTKIVAGCKCALPAGDVKVQWLWRTDDKLQTQDFGTADEAALAVWGPPGKHWIEATVVIQTYRTLTVLVPDPDDPRDPTKYKTEELTIYDPAQIQRFEKQFLIEGKVPGPDGPNGPDGPDKPTFPDGRFKLAEWAYDTATEKVPNAAQAKAQAISECFSSTATLIEPADPNLQGYDTPEALIAATVKCNQEAAGPDKEKWVPFFVAMDERLTALADSGELASMQDHKVAWIEIATGLEAIE